MATSQSPGETGVHGIGRASQEVLSIIVAVLENPNSSAEHREQALSELVPLTKDGSPEMWENHFRNMLGCLVKELEDQEVPVKVAALRALAELLKRQPQRFHSYSELTLLKIFTALKQPEREVSRAAELCALEAAAALPAEETVRHLHAVTGESDLQDVVVAAIRVISRLTEVHPKAVTVQLLPQTMPLLKKAYDHNASAVRKAAVFCMVTLHGVVGTELMHPHVASLTRSKMALLNLYIKRAQRNSSESATGSSSTAASTNIKL
ncbi:CLIP-associating protein 2-like [Dermacentor albipictus]|uniref:CLIP-associating protein 2-like n=1 Tax=Dermacentor albipictus TaxID=60249 RepID=UPI0038FCF70E